MAKIAVYEGTRCPACPKPLGQIPATLDTRAIMNVLQGGAVGAGAGLAAEFVGQRLLKITNPMIRGVLSLLVPIGIAIAVRKQNPQMAENIAIGGAAVGLYNILKGVVGPRIGLSGLEGYGQEDIEEELPEIEVEDTSGYGALVPEIEEVEGGYGQEVWVEED